MVKIEIARIGTEGGGGTLFRDDESGSAVYSTRGTYNGTNFFDRWSTKGNSTIGKTNEWIKNW